MTKANYNKIVFVYEYSEDKQYEVIKKIVAVWFKPKLYMCK